MKKELQKLEKIQKILANRGLASRREIERLIEAGKVMVNGKRATLGDRASSYDSFKVSGRVVKIKHVEEAVRVIIYHKPLGEVCTRKDPEGRKTVFTRLPKLDTGRWINIGRLDINTSGLLLFTNNGELAQKMMHPSFGLERGYAVRVFGEVDREMLRRLQQGVELEDGPSKFIRIKEAGGTGINRWFHVNLNRGRNREVRRLWESQGVKVSRLTRTTYGKIILPPNLRQGAWQELDKKQVASLLRQSNSKAD